MSQTLAGWPNFCARGSNRGVLFAAFCAAAYTRAHPSTQSVPRTMVDFAGSRAFFCPDVSDKTFKSTWRSLGGAVVQEAGDAEYHFSDDGNNDVARG